MIGLFYGKITEWVLENFSGSIGDLNFYKWKNTFVVRYEKDADEEASDGKQQLLSREISYSW